MSWTKKTFETRTKTRAKNGAALVVTLSQGMLLLIAGCSNSLTKPVLETDGKEMIEIYRNALEDGETVDDKLGALQQGGDQIARDTKEKSLNDRTALAATDYVDPAILAANKPRGRKYQSKAYTKYQGRYYNKETGHEVTTFRCGVSTKIRTKPCPKQYGFGRAKHAQPSKAEEVLVSVAKTKATGRAVTPESLIAKDQVERAERAESQRRQEEALSAALAKVTRSVPDDIKRSQQLLNKGGFEVGVVDGFLGDKTTKALSSFQARNGLVATGQLNTATMAALEVLFGDSRPSLAAGAALPTPLEPGGQPAEACNADDLYCGYSRTSDNEIQQLFPRLENPDIVVYVTPHLATHNKVPVPGYTTAFPLYDEVHYAMPGEQVSQ